MTVKLDARLDQHLNIPFFLSPGRANIMIIFTFVFMMIYFFSFDICRIKATSMRDFPILLFFVKRENSKNRLFLLFNEISNWIK